MIIRSHVAMITGVVSTTMGSTVSSEGCLSTPTSTKSTTSTTDESLLESSELSFIDLVDYECDLYIFHRNFNMLKLSGKLLLGSCSLCDSGENLVHRLVFHRLLFVWSSSKKLVGGYF